MAGSPEMRASDADREKVAAALREHMVEGRLTADEFGERLDLAYQSKTYGELAQLTRDLPATDLRHPPAVTAAAKSAKAEKRWSKQVQGLRASWATWAMASAINWVVWLAVSIPADDRVYPWPIWVMGPWGAVLLLTTISTLASRPRSR